MNIGKVYDGTVRNFFPNVSIRNYINEKEYFKNHPLDKTYGYVYVFALRIDVFREYDEKWFKSGLFHTVEIGGNVYVCVYVGQSKRIITREKEHFNSRGKREKHVIDIKIHQISKKYNVEEVFKTFLIDHCGMENIYTNIKRKSGNKVTILDIKEEYWIFWYETNHKINGFGWNFDKGGSLSGRKGNKVIVKTLSNGEIFEFDNLDTLSKKSKKIFGEHIKSHTIKLVLKGFAKCNTKKCSYYGKNVLYYKDHILNLKNGEKLLFNYKDSEKQLEIDNFIKNNVFHIPNNNQINIYDPKNGKLIKKCNNAKEVVKYTLVGNSRISNISNKSKDDKTAYSPKLKMYVTFAKEGDKPYIKEAINGKNAPWYGKATPGSIGIKVMDITNNKTFEFDSIERATESLRKIYKTNISSNTIQKVLKGTTNEYDGRKPKHIHQFFYKQSIRTFFKFEYKDKEKQLEVYKDIENIIYNFDELFEKPKNKFLNIDVLVFDYENGYFLGEYNLNNIPFNINATKHNTLEYLVSKNTENPRSMRYTKDNEDKKYFIINKKTNYKKESISDMLKRKNYIECYDIISKKYVCTLNGRKEVSQKLGINLTSINNVINGSQNSAGGYFLKEYDGTDISETEEKISKFNFIDVFGTPSTKIRAILKDSGKIYKTYESQGEAARDLDIKAQKINDVLKGRRKSYHGFIFEYLD